MAIVDLKSAGKDAEQCLNAEQLKIYALGYRQMTGSDADYLKIYNLDAPDGSKNEKEAVSGISLTEVQDGIKKATEKIRKSELPRVMNDTCKTCHVRQLCRSKE